MKNVALHNLGCKVNSYEIEVMQQMLQEKGYNIVPFDEAADIYIVNTCTVTNIADRKSRQMLHRAKQKNPDAVVVAVGCYVQTAGRKIEMDDSIDLAVGNNRKKDIVSILEQYLGERNKTLHDTTVMDMNQPCEYEEMTLKRTAEHTRAYIKIQDGCNQFCSYCVIPYARGPLRSRPLSDIHSQLARLGENGYSEVVLTGIHLMSYGKDLGDGTNLLDAIRQGQDIPGIQRIRLGSLEPQLLSDAFVQALAENPKICRQFHLSLQSGSATVLRRMARRYTPAEYAQWVARLREAMPGCAITTDVIVGFPGETEAEFQQTLDFVEQVKLCRIHVFPYSPRSGTPAARMPGQLSKAVKSQRAHILAQLADRLEAEYLAQQVGTCQAVLFEEEKHGGVEGYTDTYVRVWVPGGKQVLGQLAQVQIQQAETGRLTGQLIE